MAEGTLVDLILKNASGTTIKSYEDATALGADTGDFTRTLTDSTRFKVRGSGGSVYLEAGDASPDNTGGTMVIGGWTGTDLDSLTINATTINADGALQERGKKLQGIVYTPATGVSASANVDIPLTENVDGVRAWEIYVFDIQKSGTAGSIRARLSYDGGSNYKSGASDYATGATYGAAAATTGTAAYMELTISAEHPSGKPGLIRMVVITPDSGTDATVIHGTVAAYNNTATTPENTIFTGYGAGSYGRATHLRLYDSAGETFTCKYRVVPLYGFGEA